MSTRENIRLIARTPFVSTYILNVNLGNNVCLGVRCICYNTDDSKIDENRCKQKI